MLVLGAFPFCIFHGCVLNSDFCKNSGLQKIGRSKTVRRWLRYKPHRHRMQFLLIPDRLPCLQSQCHWYSSQHAVGLVDPQNQPCIYHRGFHPAGFLEQRR